MKLYTEEDLERAIDLSKRNVSKNRIVESLTPIELPSDMLCVNCDESKPTHNICMDCIIKVGKQNIELPSDEEIDAEWEVGYSDYQNGCNYGAKWLRDKIQGGNK